VSLETQSSLILILSFALYLVAPVPLLLRRRLISGGVLMLTAAMLPLLWQAYFTSSDAPGPAILLALEAPVPVILILAGLVTLFSRTARWLWRRRAPVSARA